MCDGRTNRHVRVTVPFPNFANALKSTFYPENVLKFFRESKDKVFVCFLFCDSSASEFCMPTFRNTLFHIHRQVGACRMNSAGDMSGVLYGKRFGLEMA